MSTEVHIRPLVRFDRARVAGDETNVGRMYIEILDPAHVSPADDFSPGHFEVRDRDVQKLMQSVLLPPDVIGFRFFDNRTVIETTEEHPLLRRLLEVSQKPEPTEADEKARKEAKKAHEVAVAKASSQLSQSALTRNGKRGLEAVLKHSHQQENRSAYYIIADKAVPPQAYLDHAKNRGITVPEHTKKRLRGFEKIIYNPGADYATPLRREDLCVSPNPGEVMTYDEVPFSARL